MEKTGRVTVQCDAILPVSDISSNGMRIPEKNIWGMKMIGNQLIAMFTFFENTLIQRPSMVPDIQAADKRKTTLKERWNPLKKKRDAPSENYCLYHGPGAENNDF